jgi:hypothetical protein
MKTEQQIKRLIRQLETELSNLKSELDDLSQQEEVGKLSLKDYENYWDLVEASNLLDARKSVLAWVLADS